MKEFFVLIFSVTMYCQIGLNAEVKHFHGFKRPCKDTSPECLRLSLQTILPHFVNGIPELSISSLDPFTVENLDIALPGGITIEVKQGYIRGLRDCIIDSVGLLGRDKYKIVFRCSLTMKGKYRSSGRFLAFAIDGEGESTIICRNIKITYTFRLEPYVKADGERYIQIKNFSTSRSFESRVSFEMTNLFKGNPDISKAVLHFLNENWRLVVNEFGGPFFEYGTMSIVNNIKKLLNTVPVDKLVA